jgi:hypothetical protein
MFPEFNFSSNISVLDEQEVEAIRELVLADKNNWENLIQKGNYKLSADTQRYDVLYKNLIQSMENHLGEAVKLKTSLDFFLFDKFDSRWEKEPSGFIHNDWGNYSKCMHEFAKNEEIDFYNPSKAIALVLPVELPECGSGVELYDAFHAEKDVKGKALLNMRANKEYSLREYQKGGATLFCPFQFHSGHCADEGTLKETDMRIVLVAFLIKYESDTRNEWHAFRMCKGATLEYGDETLYGLPEGILADR